VVGGGPAGLAAAARAAEAGAQVAIVDDNLKLGGQIWRASQGRENREATVWVDRLRRRNVTILCGWRIFHQVRAGVLLAEGFSDVGELSYGNVVVATGAREKFLPFPGWTLANVLGAGGLQAMVKSGLPIRGKRVVVAGTGPLLLAVAANLRQHGAKILMICEQASALALARLALTLVRKPEKLAQALQLRQQLQGVALSTSTWPLAALGNHVLEGVRILQRGKPKTIACEYLACGFHLVPNTELPRLLGCEIDRGFVCVDEYQRTSIPEVFSAGEPTGIGGLELSVVEGEIAGLSAAGKPEEARSLFTKRAKASGFTEALDQTFRLRSELASLPSGETIVCRCEDVPFSRLQSYRSSRAAKLQTRCGMGACQGRVCGPATEFLFNWDPDSVRPPISPVRLASLTTDTGISEVAQPISGGH
jgi:NADPH-dependent 2,4-dienoyl-CoA reductase/sulfur reductase-like enzyme